MAAPTWKKVVVSGSAAQLQSLQVDANVSVTGSLLVSTNQIITNSQSTTQLSGSFTGSLAGTLTGTASYATNAFSSSYAVSSSYALTASYLAGYVSPFPYTGSAQITGSLGVTGSISASYASFGGGINNNGAYTGPYVDGITVDYVTGNGRISVGTADGITLYNGGVGNTQLVAISTVGGVTATSGFSGSFTGSLTGVLVGTASYATTASYAVTASSAISSSYAVTASSAISSSYAGTSGKVSNALTQGTGITSFTFDGSSAQSVSLKNAGSLTNNVVTKWDSGNGQLVNSNITDSGTAVSIGSGIPVTVNSNLTVTGDLTVAGTASFNNTQNLLIGDRFAVFASGSTSLTDGGIIIASSTAGGGISGSAFFVESTSTSTYGRFAVAYNVHASASSVVADEYMNSAKIIAGAPSDATPPTWGGGTTGQGNMWVNTSTSDIYIWA